MLENWLRQKGSGQSFEDNQVRPKVKSTYRKLGLQRKNKMWKDHERLRKYRSSLKKKKRQNYSSEIA